MYRKCSQCNNSSLKLSILDVSSRIRCTHDKCIAQYEITSLYKIFAHLLSSFLLFMAFYISLALQNWVVFVFVGIIVPIFIHYCVITKGKLKFVGLKAELKKKMEQK